MLLSPAMIDLISSVLGMLICKYEPFWLEVSVESPKLRWVLFPKGFLLIYDTCVKAEHYS